MDRASPYKDHDACICDGAVRSGKTLCMSISFVLWAFSAFSGASFALCGKTVTALKRNIIVPLCEQLGELGFRCEIKASQNHMIVSKGARFNRFYFFGGRDESSAALIQGMTLSGALLDEVALMPRSFVEQTVARCSVSGSKFWFNCNPEHPRHWFYREWILKAEQKTPCIFISPWMTIPHFRKTFERDTKRSIRGLFTTDSLRAFGWRPTGLFIPCFRKKNLRGRPRTALTNTTFPATTAPLIPCPWGFGG